MNAMTKERAILKTKELIESELQNLREHADNQTIVQNIDTTIGAYIELITNLYPETYTHFWDYHTGYITPMFHSIIRHIPFEEFDYDMLREETDNDCIGII